MLLVTFIIVCAVATWVLPAGEFDREANASGTELVVPGTYHEVEQSPVGPFETVKSIYEGMVAGADVVFFVFVAYASIGLIIASGAFNGLVAWMLKILKGNARVIIIPIFYHSDRGCLFQYCRIRRNVSLYSYFCRNCYRYGI